MHKNTQRIVKQKYVVDFMFLVYEKPRNAARLISIKNKSIGKVMTPNVPTIALPTGRILCIQEKINASENNVRKIAPNTLFLLKFTWVFLDSKINSYSSMLASKSS